MQTRKQESRRTVGRIRLSILSVEFSYRHNDYLLWLRLKDRVAFERLSDGNYYWDVFMGRYLIIIAVTSPVVCPSGVRRRGQVFTHRCNFCSNDVLFVLQFCSADRKKRCGRNSFKRQAICTHCSIRITVKLENPFVPCLPLAEVSVDRFIIEHRFSCCPKMSLLWTWRRSQLERELLQLLPWHCRSRSARWCSYITWWSALSFECEFFTRNQWKIKMFWQKKELTLHNPKQAQLVFVFDATFCSAVRRLGADRLSWGFRSWRKYDRL